MLIDRILKLSFFISLIIIIFLLGYIAHKYKIKKIFQSIEPIISYIELNYDIDFDDRIGERITNKFSNDNTPLSDTNFSIKDKPFDKFDYLLFLKMDKSHPVLMTDPNNVIWRWDLSRFRNTEKLIPYLLFENGDVILGRYETKGIYKIDKNGKIIWQKDYYNHHWISADNKYLYIPGTIFLDNKNDLNDKIYENSFIKNCEAKHKSRFGTVLVVDIKNGNLIKEISLIESFYKNDSSRQIFEKYAKNCTDTIHLNDVRVLDEKKASFFENGKKGDILVSMRHINMLALIDGETHDVKWHVQGLFKYQHSPRVTNRGSILVFDNFFKSKQSRIVEIDIKSKNILGYYTGGKYNFFSNTRGRIQIIDSRLFVQSSDQGEIFEVICSEKFLNDESCESKYLFSAVFSGFYTNTGFSVKGSYIKDMIYIGDFYDYKYKFQN